MPTQDAAFSRLDRIQANPIATRPTVGLLKLFSVSSEYKLHLKPPLAGTSAERVRMFVYHEVSNPGVYG